MEKQFNLITISRVSMDKGVFDYIEVAKKLKSNFNINCYWVGSGPLLNDLKKSKIVNFVGKISEIEKLKFLDLPNSIIVSTSYYEGFALPISEGALKGIPTVSYNIKEIISSYPKYHNFVKYKNKWDMYKKIVEIMKNYDNYAKKAKKLKRFIISNYSVNAINNKLEGILYSKSNKSKIKIKSDKNE